MFTQRRYYWPRTRKPMKRGKPLRARARPKPPSVLHPNKGIRLRGQDMTELRQKVFVRSGGYCERMRTLQLGGEDVLRRCCRPIQWHTFELSHYPTSRAHGGHDTPENTEAWCIPCHREHTGLPQWTRKSA